MKRALMIATVAVLCFGLMATAAYADRATKFGSASGGPGAFALTGVGDPTVIQPFANTLSAGGGVANSAPGASAFYYADLQDSFAKFEGGYAAFSGSFAVNGFGGYDWTSSFAPGSFYDTRTASVASGTADYWVFSTFDAQGYSDSPHGGYSASTNKCKVCHAVHRAEGAYYLLRADSEGDACDYCHIGGGAHSDKIVYDLNPAGTDTTNGHTIGASTLVPDSSVNQTATTVTITGVNANMNSISTTVQVRTYDPQRIKMYRFSRHHSQNGVGTDGLNSNFKLVGPTSLSCLSCHQQHAAPGMSWRPNGFINATTNDTSHVNDYMLLKRYPSGSYNLSHGVTPSGGSNYVMAADAVAVPEGTLTPGTNFSTAASNDRTFKLESDGTTATVPTWVAGGFEAIQSDVAAPAPSWDPNTVNTYTLSVWCADCHNLDIGSKKSIPDELGFRAHAERTHPAPFQGAGAGPGQCYSCHRNDLSVSMGAADPVSADGWSYGMGQGTAGSTTTCSQCHYGTADFKADADAPVNAGRITDFPHSGSPNDVKLLGSYTANVATTTAAYNPTFSAVTISEDNLDAVCLRCHPGIGVNN
jgi:hypothetical protein